jgi:Fe-S-cluster-containing dehydrogenase component
VARVPAIVLRRGAARAGGSKIAERLERSVLRETAREVLRASFSGDLELLLDATSHLHLARGDALYRAGDPATHVHLVADGLVRRARSGERRHVQKGGVVDLEDRGERRTADVVAVAPSWILAIKREVARAAVAKRATPHAGSDAEPPYDVYRAREARSLLVIDQDACVRCGHCVSGCASSHADGVARLTRIGEKVAIGNAAPSLLLAQSCHQCEHPACLPSCPTGAITRAASGDVAIREDLCTGCGACVKACPWDNVQLAEGLRGRTVAAKCDGCGELEGGPACVRSCPTDAIARVDPAAIFGGERDALPKRRASWPAIVGGMLAASALGEASLSRMTSGALVGAAMVIATAYVLAKRAPWKRGARRQPSTAATSRLRGPFVVHVALGMFAIGGAVAHGAARMTGGVAGALAVAFWISLASGLVAGLAYRFIPRRLSRLEREGVLAEERAARAKALDDRVFTAVSGKSDGTKAIFAKLILPYARAPLGGLLLALCGRTLDDEALRLRARIRAAVGERTSGEEARELVALAVDQRAARAQRLLGGALRVGVPIHGVAVAVALALLALHVAYVLRVHR